MPLTSWNYAENSASFTSNARTQNTDTNHVAADAAGLLPICHQVGQVPLRNPLQSKDQPPSPFPLSVLPPPTWFHMGPSCPLSPTAAIVHDGLSAPRVLPVSPSFCGHSDKQETYWWQWKHRPFNLLGSSLMLRSSVGWCDTSLCSGWLFSVSLC